MTTFLTNEQQVLDALHINSFRNISKQKIMDFISLVPSMDSEKAIAIINQFPNYVDFAKHMVDQLTVTSNQIIISSEERNRIVLFAYRRILVDLGEILKRDDINQEDRDKISRQMIEIADKMSVIDAENKKHLCQITKQQNCVILFLAGIAVCTLGVNIRSRAIPHLQN